jgi:hypothetical protein
MSDIELAKKELEKEGRTFAAVKDGKVICENQGRYIRRSKPEFF